MTVLIHKPGHPFANERGMVDKNLYLEYKHLTEPHLDKRMMRGNEPVVVNYISDHMAPLRHMGLPPSSPLIDSKSKFRKITKEQGLIEVGNETSYITKPRKRVELSRQERRRAIKDTIRSYRENTISEGERAATKKYVEKVEYYNRNRKRK